MRLEGFDQTALQVPSEIKSQLPNVARVMLGSPAYYDYYRRRGVSASLSFRRVTPLRLNISVGLSREDHASLDQELTESLLGRVMETSVNPGVAEGSLDYFRIVFQRSWDDFPLPIGPQQSVKLALEKGLGGDIAGGSDYHRVEASGVLAVSQLFSNGEFCLPFWTSEWWPVRPSELCHLSVLDLLTGLDCCLYLVF